MKIDMDTAIAYMYIYMGGLCLVADIMYVHSELVFHSLANITC